MPTFDLAFTLRQGAFTLDIALRADARALALFGPSGSGKTTVIETIAGLRRPDRGRIEVHGTVLVDTEAGIDLPSRYRHMGFVPQDVLLFPHVNVRGNITYGRRPGAPGLQHVAEILELDPLLDRDVASLSGGERQRVAIGRALLSGPSVLLLDEPLASVDLPRRQRIAAALVRVRDELGVPLVYVTHAPDEAAAIADHAVVLDAGRVTASGPPAEVLNSPSATRTREAQG